MMNIRREFEILPLPVGHGLSLDIALRGIDDSQLYANGGFIKAHILYDFGAHNKYNIQKCKPQFNNNPIDLLIISHFDLDHISGIPTLLKWTKIKNIWMPGLGNEFRICLTVNEILNSQSSNYPPLDIVEIIKFIIDPKRYVVQQQENTKLLICEPFENLQINHNFEPSQDNINNTQLPEARDPTFNISSDRSYRNLSFHNPDSSWFELSVIKNGYNNNDQKIKKYAKFILDTIGMSENDFFSDPLAAIYRIGTIITRQQISRFKCNEIIKTNSSSMVVIGRPSYWREMNRNNINVIGPLHIYQTQMPIQPIYLNEITNSIKSPQNNYSGMFMGDLLRSDLKLFNRINAYTIQIPHHGSNSSFDEPFYYKNNFKIALNSHKSMDLFRPCPNLITTLANLNIKLLDCTENTTWRITHCIDS